MDTAEVRRHPTGARFVEPQPADDPVQGVSVWEVEKRGLRCVESCQPALVGALVPWRGPSADGVRLADLAECLTGPA